MRRPTRLLARCRPGCRPIRGSGPECRCMDKQSFGMPTSWVCICGPVPALAFHVSVRCVLMGLLSRACVLGRRIVFRIAPCIRTCVLARAGGCICVRVMCCARMCERFCCASHVRAQAGGCKSLDFQFAYLGLTWYLFRNANCMLVSLWDVWIR